MTGSDCGAADILLKTHCNTGESLGRCSGPGFDQLHQEFFSVRRGGQKEIHTAIVGAGTRDRINRRQAKVRFQNIRGSVHITNVKFHLLYSGTKLLQIARDGPFAAGLAVFGTVSVPFIYFRF